MVKKIVVFAMLNSYNKKENYVNSIILGMRKVRKSMMSWKKQGKTCVKRVLGGTMAAMLAVSGMNLTGTSTAQAASVKTEQAPMKIRFDEPLSKGELTGSSGNFTGAGSDTDWWQQLSLPIGNSYMGANVYGEVEKEHLTFNQKTLWNGGRQGWRTIDVRLCEISTECISERREQCIKYV